MDVHDRVNALKQLGVDGIGKLPPMGEEEADVVRGKKVRFITWHDKLDSGEHRVVVASYEPRALASYRVEAEGFAMSQDGTTRDLTEDEMASFK